MYFLYKIILTFFLIFSPFIIFARIINGKENPKRFKEKFCFFSKKSVPGKTIWIHGASVGEIQSIIPIIKKFEKRDEIKQILVTSVTLSSSLIIKKYKFKKTVHQFFPFDLGYFCMKFIDYWQPSLSIFIDSEIWPSMISNLNKKNIPVIILNARITKRSFNRWKYFNKFSKSIFNKISLAIPQNLETLNYLRLLGVKNIKRIGNLKFYGENLSKKFNQSFYNKFRNRDIWCAASTHEGEEIKIGELHKKINSKNEKFLTILIPRHINRKDSIVKKLESLGLNVLVHSSKKKINKNTDIYLVDTYGEVLDFFRLTKVVFMGGSLVKHGGQNPLEAARLGNLVIHGPNIENFKEIYNFLENLKFSIRIKNASEIEKYLNTKKQKKIKTKKLYTIGEKILLNNIKELDKYI